MGKKEVIKIFDDRNISVVWDDEQEVWYFCVVDVVEVLTESKDPKDYLKKMRKRDPELNAYMGTNCPLSRFTGGQALGSAASFVEEPCAAECFCTVLGVCANERLFNIRQFGKSLFLSNFAVTFALVGGRT
jgi:hypothetical protein